MEESILQSVKQILGIDKDCTDFDSILLLHINSVLMTSDQLGIEPKKTVESTEDAWTDVFGSDVNTQALSAVKSYMGLKVRLLFDPPTSSVVTEAINRQISELEWRLSVAAETVNINELKATLQAINDELDNVT